jgi:hypothetical protein
VASNSANLPTVLVSHKRSFKAALHDASTEVNQVCKLLAKSYLSFVNIYFLKIDGKSSAVQVVKQAGWQGKGTESCSVSDRIAFPHHANVSSASYLPAT